MPAAADTMFCSAIPIWINCSGQLRLTWCVPVPPATSPSSTTMRLSFMASVDIALPKASLSDSPWEPISLGAAILLPPY